MEQLAQAPMLSSVRAFLECASDNAFGPFSDCRFDFTLFFEQAIISAIPAIFLLLSAPSRIHRLFRQDEKVLPSTNGVAKLILTIPFALVQLVLLTLCSKFEKTDASLPAVVLNLLVAILVVPLSYLEHKRSVRPSSILCTYFLFSFMFDLAQARTLYLLEYSTADVFSFALALKLLLFIVESQNKSLFLKPQYEDLSPEATAGIVSRSFLWRLNVLFSKGSKSILKFEELYGLDPELEAETVGRKMRRAWEKRSKKEGRIELVFALWRALKGSFALVLFPRLCLIGFTFAQPFLITRVLSLLEEADDEMSRKQGYGLMGATALIYLGIAVSMLLSGHNMNRFITMFRGGMVTLIYSRALLLKDGVYEESAAVSLMSNDVDQISDCLEELNEVWSRTIEIGIGLPLLTLQLGWVSIIPLLVVFISAGGASVVANIIGDRQKLWADATQKRLAITSSMLREMSSLKMMGLDEVVGENVQAERVAETKRLESWAWIKIWQNVIANTPYVMAPAATFGVYALQAFLQGSESLNTVQAFTSLALIGLVTYPASRLLAAVPNVTSSIGCFDRIQAYLLTESRIDQRQSPEPLEFFTSTNGVNVDRNVTKAYSDLPDPTDHDPRDGFAIVVEKANIRPAAGADIVLRDVSLKVQIGSTVMITGPVGAGKTTLLRAILGEIPCESGTIYVKSRRAAYCSQTPWLMSGTIRAAICGMTTESVDEAWYKTVIEGCALDYDISRFPAGDQTLIGSRGVTLSGGQKQRVCLARALYSRAEIFVLDDVLSALDKKTEKMLTDRLLGNGGLFDMLGSTVIMVTHATQYLKLAHRVIVIPGPGGEIHQGEYRNIKEAGFIDEAAIEEKRPEEIPESSPAEDMDAKLEEVGNSNEARDLARQSGDTAVYKYYFNSVGLWYLAVFVFFAGMNVFAGTFSQIWLKWWTDVEGRQIGLYIGIYFLLAFLYSFGNGGYIWAACVVIGPSTGRKLHRVLLNSVLKAPLSFFSETETGSILSRFSQDMSLIEGQLAFGVLATITNLLACLAEAALVATGSPLTAFTTPLFIIAVYFLQRIYLRTSRQLRFLDLESRSPVYSHFLETIDGLTTIRAFGWQIEFTNLNAQRLDDSQKPYYLLFCIQQWLRLVLDMIVAGMAVLVVALALSFKNSTNAGLLGVSMNSVLSFNVSLSQFINGWTVLETALGAIARLRLFEIETPVEAKEGEDFEPPEDWPSKGLIEIRDVTAYHGPSTIAINNISLTIQPGLTVVICGRTGSGKSSLLATLTRILDPSTGTLRIDSLDLSRLPRSLLRQHLTIVPQNPLHLTGSVRYNLDPFSLSSDPAIISSLTKVHLWSILSERGGLDAELLPDTLSRGQQQLVALARAILMRRGRKVVLLDEATSSVDGETEGVIKRVLKEEFGGCTVVMVAHRRETILGAEIAVVMDGGRVVEVGRPGELMARDGRLRELLGGAEGL